MSTVDAIATVKALFDTARTEDQYELAMQVGARLLTDPKDQFQVVDAAIAAVQRVRALAVAAPDELQLN